ncbi:restriction endonuclease subunit S [Aeromonas caviae]|uniref:restriction endonuclease subunit S n=1 Tax=Aeromonas caviae TaxID=648 RepID=UPI0020B8278F|nr:restriction endonuclease subunit S [Aeromonas caviae]UTI02697.1 restriction endonuclease subunit S [Aeromonas caviae]
MVPCDWTDGHVGDLLKGLESGVSVNGEDRAVGPNDKAVLKVSAVSYGCFNPLAAKVVEGDELFKAKTNPKNGQIIISRSNTEDLVGASAYIDEDYPNLFLPDKLWQTIPKKDADMKWLSYFLASAHARYTLSNLATGTSGSMKNITKGELLSLKVQIPPLPEQRKIAQILSTWDEVIATTERLIANSQQQRKALMQQLLTGKKRFGMAAEEIEYQKTRYGLIPVDWDYPSIGQVCTQVSRKNTEQADYPVLSCSKHDGFVDSLRYFKKKVYSDDTSGYRVIPYGCFGFPSNHIEEGSIGLQELYDFGIVSPIYVVFQPDESKVNRKFLLALLKTEHYRQIFAASTNASVDRRGSLRWKEFCAIHVPLPSLPEQNKIADALSAADKEIDGFKQQLVHFKQEKQALMQQLLTGKRRVKVDDKEVA